MSVEVSIVTAASCLLIPSPQLLPFSVWEAVACGLLRCPTPRAQRCRWTPELPCQDVSCCLCCSISWGSHASSRVGGITPTPVEQQSILLPSTLPLILYFLIFPATSFPQPSLFYRKDQLLAHKPSDNYLECKAGVSHLL